MRVGRRLVARILAGFIAFSLIPFPVDYVMAEEVKMKSESTANEANEVSLGDYIYLGKYYDKPILWRCVDKDENGLLMLSDKILCFKSYDAFGEDEYYHSDGWGYIRKKYGSNCWEDSSIREWLNDNSETVTYSHCSPSMERVGDGYNPYDDESGFLYNFNISEQKCIKQVTQIVNVNEWETKREGYCDGGFEEIDCKAFYDYPLNTDYTNYYYKRCSDKIFLLNAGQINHVYNNFGDYIYAYPTEDAVYNNDEKSSDIDSSKICPYRTNVPGTIGASFEHVETIPEELNPGGAYTSCGIRPAFYLDDKLFSGKIYKEKPSSGFTFTVDSTSMGYVNEESSFAGTLTLNEDVENGDDILTEEIHNIIWTSSNQDIISDSDIYCSVSSKGKFNVKFTPKKCGHVTLTGMTSDGSLSASAKITVVVSLKYRTDGKVEGSELYSGTKSSNTIHSYYYSDDFFYGNSTNYNNSLAVITLGLELSSFSCPKYDGQYKDTIDEKLRAENIVDAYGKLGFKNAKYYNYDTPLSEDSDKAAYSFAQKTISNGQSKDTLIAVVVRGGGYGAEWVSNFHVGNNGNANGFDTAASEILPNLKKYINSTSIDGELKLWITGYSRGGAVANILTHYINENMVEVHSTLKQSNIYAYTFATPNGYRKDDINYSLDNNIWNVVSANDLVPKLALAQWGFSKYGNTRVLPEYSSAALKKNFKTYTGETLELSTANNAEVALTDVLYDITFGTEGWTKTLEHDVMDAFRALYTKSILDKVRFATEAIKAVDEVLKVKLGAYKLIYALSCAIGEELAYILTSTEGDPSIAHVMTNFMMAHYPEHYLCWLEGGNSMILKDGFYASLSQEGRDAIDKTVEGLFASTYKKYHFYCPVDVEVYDNSGKIVVNIVNNKVITEDIPCYVDGDEKVVYLPDTGKYEIKLTGNDKGSMDYIVQEYNIDSEVVRSVYYYDVPLEDGVIYTDLVEGNVLNKEENYSITDGNKQLEPALDTIEAADDVKKYIILTKNGVASKSEAIENESVSIVSMAGEGFEFIKWTSNLGDGIFDDPLASKTRIRMPAQDIEIEAVLAKSKEEEYTISYDLKGGQVTGNPIIYTRETETFTLKNPIKAGYTFIGWTGSNGNIPQEIVTILKGTTGALSYVANWEKISSSDNADRDSAMETDPFSQNDISIAKVALKKKSYVYDGKKRKPVVTVKIGSTTLTKGIHYTVSYKNNKNIGTASVTITGIGNYIGSITKMFKIVPKGTSLLKLSVRKKGFSVSWNKQAKFTDGYQVQYSTSKKFTGKISKINTVKKNKITKLTVLKLKGKKKYYIRVRTYKTVKGKKCFSSWSKVKTVTTKK